MAAAVIQADRPPRIIAAIPCYNEAGHIEDVVRRALPFVDAVLVIDDGSTDATVAVAEAAGAIVYRHEVNSGPGAAARSCFKAAIAEGADILVTLDGDGQHDPEEIPTVTGPISSGLADFCIGSRFIEKRTNIRAYRRFGIWVITTLVNLASGARLTDGQSGFRAYSRRAIESLEVTDPGFGFSVETLVQARALGLRIVEAPVSCLYHDDGSSLNPVSHGVGVALAVLKHRLRQRSGPLTAVPAAESSLVGPGVGTGRE